MCHQCHWQELNDTQVPSSLPIMIKNCPKKRFGKLSNIPRRVSLLPIRDKRALTLFRKHRTLANVFFSGEYSDFPGDAGPMRAEQLEQLTSDQLMIV